MSLPFLPGNSFSKTLGREKFNKSHHFDLRLDEPMWVGESKPGVGAEPLPGQKFKSHSILPQKGGCPAWVAYDKQVLSFNGYFLEAVHEKNDEQYRIRKVKIFFYLEDDSVQVNEPPIVNSGIPQGTIIRRHKVPLPPSSTKGHDTKFYTVEYFNVGNEIKMYGRVFKLTDCDSFTRNFLAKMDTKIGESSKIPCDPHTVERQKMLDSMQPLRPYERIDTLKQFLEHDRHVLEFGAYWDDTENTFGEIRELKLHYFLGDDTIEIREVIRPNDGRDSVPVFLRRGLLPRNAPIDQVQPGVDTDRTVLNVCNSRYILDSLKTGAVHREYITDADLRVGNVISVWGRPLKLVSQDEFTKNYYSTKYGVKEFHHLENIAIPKPKAIIPKQVPPYNGFGTEEDTLCSCAGLIPKPPQRDFGKFMELDRNGLDSHVLRFVAMMDTDYSVDKARRFILSFYLSDDTIAVFEPPQRNSGVLGGKYLERGRVKLPGQEIFKSELTTYYTSRDFYVGAKLVFNDIPFIIVGADDYAISYMESHADEYEFSNIKKMESKITAALVDADNEGIKNKLQAADKGDGSVSYEVIGEILINLGLNSHEILTVARNFAKPHETHEPGNDIEKTRSLVQEKLRKKTFEDFTRLLEAFEYEDMDKSGKLTLNKVNTVCQAFKIPISAGRLKLLLDICTADGLTDYSKFVNMINWCDNPSAPCRSEDFAPRIPIPRDIPLTATILYKNIFKNL